MYLSKSGITRLNLINSGRVPTSVNTLVFFFASGECMVKPTLSVGVFSKALDVGVRLKLDPEVAELPCSNRESKIYAIDQVDTKVVLDDRDKSDHGFQR